MTKKEVLDIPLAVMLEELHKQLNLSIEEDKIFWLAFREQLSQEEIAYKVGMDIKRVRQAIKHMEFKISFVKKMY